MKFSCEKYLLQQAVGITSRCAAAKSPMPALEGLLVEAGQDVRITGYDLKKGIYTSFPADVAEPGSIVLSAKLFSEIVRSLPDGIVTVTVLGGMKTTITCEASDFVIMGSSSEEYPELPSVDKQNSIAVPQNILSKMIRQTIFAVSDNEIRPVYTGSLLELQDGVLTMVSVDGFRLALRREHLQEQDTENCSFIVPGAALNDVEKLCSDTEDAVNITVGDKHISFAIGDTVLISRRLEGEFLNYKKSIPTEFSLVMEANREDFMRAVGRVSLIIDEKTKNPLRLVVEENQIKINCVTGVGSGDDRCSIKLSGTPGLVIGFNNRYLLDALKAAPTESVSVGMNTASSPCVISPSDGSDSFSYMILPVRLKAE